MKQILASLKSRAKSNKNAILYQDRAITYGELFEKITERTRLLKRLGVKKHTCVAVSLTLSDELIITLLAIFECGATYLPIDHEYPVKRKAHIIKECRPSVLITDTKIKDSFLNLAVTIVCLGALPATPNQLSALRGTTPWRENIAYIVYTSGSTGNPKGVLISYDALNNYLTQLSSRIKIKSSDIYLVLASISFSSSIRQILLPLLSGACLYIAQQNSKQDTRQLITNITKNHLTIIDVTTSFFQNIIDQLFLLPSSIKAQLSGQLRMVLCASEPLLTSIARTWYADLEQNAQIVNMYGQTETTGIISTYFVDQSQLTSSEYIPIGTPLAENNMYILDKKLKPVQIGCTGTLYIESTKLFSGYVKHSKQDQTDVITQNTQANNLGALFNTGDTVRYLGNDVFEFVLRDDMQVKINGIRINLGEIESILNRNRDIKRAVVDTKKHGNIFLIVAYILQGKYEVDEVILREWLKEYVPQYMLPNMFCVLDVMPTNYSGKIDRKALSKIADEKLCQMHNGNFKNEVEKEIAIIWSKIFGLPIQYFGSKSNFLTLGGHSLLTIKLIQEISTQFDARLSISDIFDNPTIFSLASLIINHKHPSDYNDFSKIPVYSQDDNIPFSNQQLAIWLSETLSSNKSLYNIPILFQIEGNIQDVILISAIRDLVAATKALRMNVYIEEARHYFKVHAGVDFTVKTYSFDVSDERILDIIKLDATVPFELNGKYLFRASIYKSNRGKCFVLLVAHHLVADRSSMGIICEALGYMYNQYLVGSKPNIPTKVADYTDYLLWKHTTQSTKSYHESSLYWKNVLSNIPDKLTLPYDYIRPKHFSHNGAVYYEQLDTASLNQIKIFATSYNSSIHMLLLSTLYTLLFRYTGKKDIIIGSPVTSRKYPECGGMIGCFVNTLPIRINIAQDDITFETLLEKIQDITLAAYFHNNDSLEQMMDSLKLQREDNWPPLFQAVLVTQNVGELKLSLSHTVSTQIFLNTNSTHSELRIWATESLNGLELGFEYSTDLFKTSTIKALCEHFIFILKNIVHNPHTPVKSIPILDKAEQATLISYGTCHQKIDHQLLIDDLFEIQVRHHPDKLAVIQDDTIYSYAELNALANQLACYLCDIGVQPDDVVGVCLERSPLLIVSLFGILKAGGAYLPVDPSDPKERLVYIIEDAKPLAVIVQNSTIHLFASNQVCRLINIDLILETLKQLPEANLPKNAQIYNLAYIIYTSGTTGKPKGVMIEHRSCAIVVESLKEKFYITRESKVLQFAPFCFDASIAEILPTLLSGATLVMASNEDRRSPQKLITLIDRFNVNVAILPPALLENIPKNKLLNTLTTIIVAGDICSKDALDFWSQGRNLVNAYGPTEATICATVHNYTTSDNNSHRVIGKPINGVNLYVLDPHLNLVPIRVYGELYIGGRTLARGYLNQHALTSEKFITSPFDDNSIIYKTGDIVRWTADGNLEFSCRSDAQIKIRGYRIELAEIEHILQLQQNIKRAVVIATEIVEDTRKILIAFLILKNDAINFSSAALMEGLKKEVPSYLLPSKFIIIKSLPLTINGKIDYDALEKLVNANNSISNKSMNTTKIEQRLLNVLRNVLNTQLVSISDNFFESGGDSIMCIQFVAKANKEGINLTVDDVFSYPTIAAMVQKITSSDTNKNLEPVNLEHLTQNAQMHNNTIIDLPLLPIQHWFFEQEISLIHHYNQTILVQTRCEITIEQLNEIFAALAKKHDVFHINFHYKNNTWTQVFNESFVGYSCSELNMQHKQIHHEQIVQIVREYQKTLNITNGPLFKVLLVSNFDSNYLILIAHHLIMDSVSWRILLDDLQDYYSQQLHDTCSGRGDYYRYWASYTEKHAHDLTQEHEFVGNTISKFSATSALQSEFNNGVNSVEHERIISFELDDDATSLLKDQAMKLPNTSLQDILLTAFILSWWSEHEHITCSLYMESHGRNTLDSGIDLTKTLGWFTSLYPVTLTIDNTSDLLLAVQQIGRQLQEVPQNGIPYGLLRYCSNSYEVVQQLKKTINPQICFNYLGQFDNIFSSNLFSLVHNESYDNIAKENIRPFLIEVITKIRDEKLHACIKYSANHFSGELIKNKVDLYKQQIQEIVRYLTRHQSLSCNLSAMQSGILFHHLSNLQSNVYSIRTLYNIVGELNEDVFKNAWHAVINSHIIFRSKFIWKNTTTPEQQFVEDIKLPWEFRDLSELSQDAQQSTLDKMLLEDYYGFDITTPPLTRIKLIKWSQSRYSMVWDTHDIILDGWSGAIILKQVLDCYHECIHNTEIPKFALSNAFYNYIKHHELIDCERVQKFWTNYLSEFKDTTYIASKIFSKYEDENNTESKDIASHDFTLLKEQTDLIYTFAKKQRTTVTSVVQATWALLVSRYVGRNDIIFGLTLSGRTSTVIEKVEEIVGVLTNTIPVRVIIDPEDTPITLTNKIHKQYSDLIKNSYIKLTDIQNCVEKELLGTQLFDHIIVVGNYPRDYISTTTDKDLIKLNKISSIEQNEYPLTLRVFPAKELKFQLLYDKKKFLPFYIRQLARHFTNLLKEIEECPDITLSSLSILDNSEMNTLLLEWNDTATPYHRNALIHELFEHQVSINPSTVAVIGEQQKYTYAALNSLANKFARNLKNLGIQPNDIIGICLERSPELIVAILGILKAGAAYLPLDSTYPIERLRYMIDDASPKVLVTQDKLTQLFQKYSGQIIILDTTLSSIQKLSDKNLTQSAKPTDLVYVTYTSGSTGEPKGVMIEHRSLINKGYWMQKSYPLKPDDRWIHKTSISFDVSVGEIFWPLINGASVAIPQHDRHKEIDYLTTFIESYRVTDMHFVPSMLETFLQFVEHRTLTSKLKSIKRVFCSGEALASSVNDKFLSIFPGIRLHNIYGPTEVGETSAYEYKYDEYKTGTVSIGKPISNTQYYVLDHQNNPVPIGVPGELYIGGESLARGYLNKPKLATQVFIQNPLCTKQYASFISPSIVYKTGDIVYYHPDGNLEFVGRIDHQVKIRGYRIELKEIEAAIRRYDSVRQAFVLPTDNKSNAKTLTAVVITNDVSLNERELKLFLAGILPSYMIPDTILCLQDFPITDNGKMDRDVLYAYLKNYHYNNTISTLPRNATEIKVAKIWARLLKTNTEMIGIYDEFKLLGGHSLQLIKLCIELEKEFAVTIALSDLINNQTIEKQQQLILMKSSTVTSHDSAPTKPDVKLLFLIHPGSGLSLSYYKLEGLPIYGINNPFFSSQNANFASIHAMAEAYVKIIKEVQQKGPYRLGGWSLGGVVALEIASLLTNHGDKVEVVLLIDSWNPDIFKKYTIEQEDLELYLNNEDTKLNEEEHKLVMAQLKHSINMLNIHVPKNYSGYTVLIKAQECQQFSDEHLHSMSMNNGWQNVVSSIEVTVTPGNHSNLFSSQYIQSTLTAIKYILKKCDLA